MGTPIWKPPAQLICRASLLPVDDGEVLGPKARRCRFGGGLQWFFVVTRPGKHTKNDGKSPFFMGKFIISMAIFNSYFDNQRVVT